MRRIELVAGMGSGPPGLDLPRLRRLAVTRRNPAFAQFGSPEEVERFVASIVESSHRFLGDGWDPEAAMRWMEALIEVLGSLSDNEIAKAVRGGAA